jgi:hypothetical protein
VVFRRFRVADGSIASVRTRRISVVPSLAASVSPVDISPADHHLDGEHYADLLRLASTHARTPLAGSGLDHVAGIWIRGSSGGDDRFTPEYTTYGTTTLS